MTAFLTVALGIGATAAIFTVLDAVVLKPLTYPEPKQLFWAGMEFRNLEFTRSPQSLATYAVYKRFSRTIEGIAIADPLSVNVADPDGTRPAARLNAARVTANALPLLGATFARGRGFLETDDDPRAPPVAIISGGLCAHVLPRLSERQSRLTEYSGR